MLQAVLFDVNETLLDAQALDPLFTRLFWEQSARERWSLQLQALWLTSIATGRYDGFGRLAEAALQMEADKRAVTLSADDRTELAAEMNHLPPYTDVRSALTQLRDGGFRLACLTNGTQQSLHAQMAHAQLADFFELLLSVEEVQRYKPAPEPYRMACRKLNLSAEGVVLVAAHAWDIAGAAAAGLKTAFIRRPRKTLNPLGPKPDFEHDDLLRFAERLIASSRPDVDTSRAA